MRDDTEGLAQTAPLCDSRVFYYRVTGMLLGDRTLSHWSTPVTLQGSVQITTVGDGTHAVTRPAPCGECAHAPRQPVAPEPPRQWSMGLTVSLDCLPAGDRAAVAPWRHKALRRVLHLREHRRAGQVRAASAAAVGTSFPAGALLRGPSLRPWPGGTNSATRPGPPGCWWAMGPRPRCSVTGPAACRGLSAPVGGRALPSPTSQGGERQTPHPTGAGAPVPAP